MSDAPRDDGVRAFENGFRVFAGPADEPRARRASDVTSLVGSTALLLAIAAAANPRPGIAAAFETFLRSFPTFLVPVWKVGVDLLVVLAAVVVAAALIRRRWKVLRDQVVVAVLALGVSLLLGRIVGGSWADIGDSLSSSSPPEYFPAIRLAVPAAVMIASSPHLTRPLRRLIRWTVVYASLAVVMLGSTSLLGMASGLLVAIAAAAVVNLVFGSSAGRPSLQLVGASLAELGVAIRSIGVADRQQAGFFLVTATDDHGRPLVVKVYGRDAHDAALMSTVWRTLWYREAGSPLRFRRVEQVEHEAFLILLAGQAGVPTDTVVTAGVTSSDDALLVVRPRGDPLGGRAGSVGRADTPDADSWDLAVQLWGLVRLLHANEIGHGQLDLDHVTVVESSAADRAAGLTSGTIGLNGFRGAVVAPSELRRRTDEVQAFVATVGLLGADRGVQCAVECLGHDGLAAIVAYLQPPSLTRPQVDQTKRGEIDLDDLRRRAAAATGIEVPKLQQLRRITVGAVLRWLLPVLALFALYLTFSNVSWDDVIDEVRGAIWWIVGIGLVVAQLPRLAQSCSTLGASPVQLPLGPVYALQLAMSYINLAIPSSAARVATSVRFFQRHGLSTGAALATGAVDGFAGFVVQGVLILGFLLFTPLSLDLDFGGAGPSGLLVAVVAVGVGSILVVLLVGPWRRRILGELRRLLGEARSALHGLNSTRRLLLLFGGNLGSDLLFALALSTMVVAFGESVGFAEVLLINIVVSLFAGLLPIPGGVGVTEGGLVWGLTEAGVSESAAVAAVILYRLGTFYLPPIWGFFAFRWLERNDHL